MNIIDTFFNILRTGVVAMMLVIFGFTFTYAPSPINHVETAEAGGVVYDPSNFIQNLATNIATTASSVANAAISFATGNLWIKENILDGLAWTLAKGIISDLVSGLVDWINTGFEGNPTFLLDLQNHLSNASVDIFEEYQDYLVADDSYLCDPGGVDTTIAIQVALEEEFNRQIEELPQPVQKCEIDRYGGVEQYNAFVDGDFEAGGWDSWLNMVSQPSDTPYGQYLAASEGVREAVARRVDEERTYLDYGDGFLSGETCFGVTIPGVTEATQECVISKPGKIIQDALARNLDSGRESLLAADEFNEILSALITNLANDTLTGASGLLGLTPDLSVPVASTYTDNYLTDGLADEVIDGVDINPTIQASLETQQEAAADASSIEAIFQNVIDHPFTPDTIVAQFEAELGNITDLQDRANANVTALQDLNAQTGNAEEQADITRQYNALQSNLISDSELSSRNSYWRSLINTSNALVPDYDLTQPYVPDFDDFDFGDLNF